MEKDLKQMGKATNQIATFKDAYSLKGETSSDTKLITKAGVISMGLGVNGTYEDKQCVKYSDLYLLGYKILETTSIPGWTSDDYQRNVCMNVSTSVPSSSGFIQSGHFIKLYLGVCQIIQSSGGGRLPDWDGADSVLVYRTQSAVFSAKNDGVNYNHDVSNIYAHHQGDVNITDTSDPRHLVIRIEDIGSGGSVLDRNISVGADTGVSIGVLDKNGNELGTFKLTYSYPVYASDGHMYGAYYWSTDAISKIFEDYKETELRFTFLGLSSNPNSSMVKLSVS